MTSPMERTLAELRKDGIVSQVVERYFPKSKKYPFGCKQDLFNIIDVLALDNGIVGIQVTGSDFSSHVQKITEAESENTRAWLENKGRLEIHGWRKVKKVRGGKAMVWKPRIADVLLVNNEIYVEERE